MSREEIASCEPSFDEADDPAPTPNPEWSHLDSNQGPPACEEDKEKIRRRTRISWTVLRRWFQTLITRFRKSANVRR